MRAYHTSEINHKQHTIDILKTALTSIIAFYGGLIAYTISSRPKFYAVVVISLAVIVLAWWFVYSLVDQSCKKIDQDHVAYKRHRGEYVDALTRLGLTSTHWRPLTEAEDKDTGYSHTKKILSDLRLLVTGIAIAGSLLSCLIAWN